MKAQAASAQADIHHYHRVYDAISDAAADGRYIAQITGVPERIAHDIASDLRDDGYDVGMTEPGEAGQLDEGRVTLRASW